jgi:hypothetical protein
MARAERFGLRAAAARWRRLLVVLVGLIAAAALAAAAVRLSRWWRVPQVAVAGAPAGVLVASKHDLSPAPGGEVPWGLLDAGPQFTIAGDLIAKHPRPDGNLHYFQEVGLPWMPGLRQPCPTWGDDFASGAAVFACRFASPDSAAALIAYYRRLLGEKGMTPDGPDSVTWVLPRATGNPGVESSKALTIQPYDLARERSISSCLVAPSIAARAVVTISEMSRVRNWPRR